MEWLAGFLSVEWAKIAAGLGVAGILAGVSKSVTDHLLGQRKELTTYRRAKIAEWRAALHTVEWSDLGSTPAYAEMRRYVRKDIVTQVERPRTVIFPGGRAGDPRKQMLLDEVSRIEQNWGLI